MDTSYSGDGVSNDSETCLIYRRTARPEQGQEAILVPRSVFIMTVRAYVAAAYQYARQQLAID